MEIPGALFWSMILCLGCKIVRADTLKGVHFGESSYAAAFQVPGAFSEAECKAGEFWTSMIVVIPDAVKIAT